MVLKTNDRRTSCPCHDEFRGPRSDYVRQVVSENNNNVLNAIETPRNTTKCVLDISPERPLALSEQEEDERGPMPTSASKDLFKKWDAVRAMVLEWHPNQADVNVSRFGDLYDNAFNYFGKNLKKREKQSTLDMFFNAP
ncbi:uncharacterized protein TNCV_1786241 [Trichonephila clavipes]|nr:uncharacterized protein TNCV_1786241 [Trichonephila clavipes]